MAVEEAEAAKERGNVAFKAKDYSLALKCFTEAIKHDPTNIKYLSNRSAVYLKLREYENSIVDGAKCVEMDPDWGKGYSRQGQGLCAMGEYAKAIAVYAQGLGKDPTNKLLTQGLATAQTQLMAQADERKNKEKPKKKKKRKKKNKNGSKIPEPKDVKDVDDVDDLEEKKGEGYVIGIDLGTTFSCVGVWKGDGVQIIETNDGDRTIPSYVAFLEDSTRITGYQAKNQATRNPRNTIYDVKRIIGQRWSDPGVEKDCSNFPFAVVRGPDDKPLIEIKDTEGNPKEQFAAEEISSMVLTTCKTIAEKFLGQKVSRAVITVPAYFNDAQRNATKAAGMIAGLDVLRIINEPTAAALAYGLDNVIDKKKGEEGMKVLIFDLGGGTFDVSILSIEGGIFTVIATGGDTRLGGEDFDNSVIEYIISEIKKHPNCPPQEPRENLRALQRIRKACEAAKRQLSNSKSTTITLDSLMTQKFDFRCKLTRQKFEVLNRGSFALCLDVVKRVLKDAKCRPIDIDEIVLVGGSTRIPKIQQLLQDHFDGKHLCKTLNPDEAVAYGAAVQGAILNGNRNAKTADLLLMDVTPLSLGVETTGRVMSVIIPRNTPIPCSKTQTYTTEQNYQTRIDVSVYEGERLKTDDNNLLGEFTIAGLESAKRGEPQVDVNFSIDSNGILSVKAEDKKTGSEAHIDIANRSRANNEDIERMVKEAEKFRKQDLQRVQRIEAKNELETCIYQVLDVVSQIEDSEKKLAGILRQAAEKEQMWLDDGNAESARVSEIRMRIRNLNKRVQNK